ncbi:hypothetical protein F8M41_001688 [Gigaspora margarita]|uniref:Uncharacterized protein n=1 Tax=Gigaspora margarita TaxID=4874 RepID=A0A8H4A9T7_GIGMA|nr:hypothetical protein F8M41_001688 [Gigaspora margarita]
MTEPEPTNMSTLEISRCWKSLEEQKLSLRYGGGSGIGGIRIMVKPEYIAILGADGFPPLYEPATSIGELLVTPPLGISKYFISCATTNLYIAFSISTINTFPFGSISNLYPCVS